MSSMTRTVHVIDYAPIQGEPARRPATPMSSTARTPRLTPSADTDAGGATGAGHHTIAVALDEASLRDHLAAWEDLARNLAEPNAFYEPWALLSAIRHLGLPETPHFVLVYLHRADQSEPLLCGFFPLQRRRLHRFLPVAVVEPWRHIHCVLCTPLLRRRRETPAFEAFFDWLNQDSPGAPPLRLDLVSGDGAFARACVIASQYVATGHSPGDLMISVIPFARWLRQSIRSRVGS